MLQRLSYLLLVVGALDAQTFTLGVPSDPCTGGAPYAVANSPIPTLRYGTSFSCMFAATGGAGAYIVELDFVEPAAYVPASDINGRSFNVTVTDAWSSQSYGSLTKVDLFTEGATSSAVVIARSFLVFSGDGRVKVSLTTIKRSAVISRVKITPALWSPAPITTAAVPAVTVVGATQTQALIAITGATGACTLELSKSRTYVPLEPDVDVSQYSGSNTDIGRPDTIKGTNGVRVVTLGHQAYNRPLFGSTDYYLRLSNCGGTATAAFTTPPAAFGTTSTYPPPFDPAMWGNRASPVTMAALLNKTPMADPQTGVAVRVASGPGDFTWVGPGHGIYPGTWSFGFVAGGTGWTNASSANTGTSSTATTTNTNPIDLYPGWQNSEWEDPYLRNTFDDLGVKLFGSGVAFTVCMFFYPTTGCIGTPFTVTPSVSSGAPQISSGSSDPDQPFPVSFPHGMFNGWGSNVFVPAEHRLTHGKATVAANVVTIDGYPDRLSHFSTVAAGKKIYIAGSTCPGMCTIAKVISAKQASLVETIADVTTSAAYYVMGFGVRIQKTATAGTLTVGAEFKVAGSIKSNNQGGAENAVCPSGSFATGDTPPKQARVCSLPTASTGFNLWYFLMDDGTARPYHNGMGMIPPASYFTSTLGWAAADVPSFTGICCGVARAHPGADGRTWLVAGPNSVGGVNLYSMRYNGDTTEDRDWHYSLQIGGDAYMQYPPTNKQDWTLLMGSTNTLATQIASLYPSYNGALYGYNFEFQGSSDTTVYYENQYSGMPQNGPAWMAIVDISSGTGVLTDLIHTMDGTGTKGGIRFGGVHNLGPVDVPNTAQITNWFMTAGDTKLLHGGPFLAPITHVKKGGLFVTDTSLPWPPDSTYDSVCPVGNPYESLGATGNQCFTFAIPAGGWCNVSPRADEKATWPCPTPKTPIAGWTPSNYAAPFPIRPGDVFVDGTIPNNSTPGDWENFRVVQLTPGTGPNGETVGIGQRNATPEYCCVAPGPVAGSVCSDGAYQNVHANGWMPLASPTRLSGCNNPIMTITGKTESTLALGDVSRYLAGHGDLAVGTTPGNVVWVSAAGATTQKPIDHVFDIPVISNTTVPPTFHGATLSIGGGGVQAYSRTPGGVNFMNDSNSLNNNGGGGREDLGGPLMWGLRELKHITGDIWTIEVMGTVDPKVFPMSAWAGRHNLKEVSGPSCDITAMPYSFGYATHNNECYPGSVAGATGANGRKIAYINLPAAYDVGNGYCYATQHFMNIPCVISGMPGAGAFRQQVWGEADSDSHNSRLLTMLFDNPGGQYAYNQMVPLNSKAAWGPSTFTPWGSVSFLVSLPDQYGGTGIAQDFVPTPITIPAGPAYAEVEFGYSYFGGPADFHCMPRNESCNTSGSPLAFASDAKTLTPTFASGGTINIQATVPNTVYYRINRSLDGVTWTNGETQAMALSGVVVNK